MKRRIGCSVIVILLGFFCEYALSSLMVAANSLARQDVQPSSISIYTPTKYNLISMLNDSWRENHPKKSSFNFSNENKWLTFYRRRGFILAEKRRSVYKFYTIDDVPKGYPSSLWFNNLAKTGIIFVSYSSLSAQGLDFWQGDIYAVTYDGSIYIIPKSEKQKFIDGLNAKWLAYERRNTFEWYKDYVWYVVAFALIVLWIMPLYRSLRNVSSELKNVNSIEVNITFKHKE